MATQQALVIPSLKAPFTLKSLWPIPKPGPRQVLIKIKATGLNPVDWKQQKYGIVIEKYPAIPGLDIAGDVEELGECVEGFAKGEKVFAMGYFPDEMSAYQQFCVIPFDLVGKMPPNIDYARAASIPTGYCTVAVGLLAALPAGAGLDPTMEFKSNSIGQPAFILGGSSCVGQFGSFPTRHHTLPISSTSIQLLRLQGFSPIITYASGKHTAYLHSLGATHIIDRASVSLSALPDAVHCISGSTPIKLAFDTISDDETKAASLAVLADNGLALTLVPPGEDRTHEGGKRNIGILGSPHYHREIGKRIWQVLPKQVEQGIVVPNRVEVLPDGLAGIVGGLEIMERGEASGVKLVVCPHETP
ncbi:chaperonin 10-like protein [Roridomyces roridus]|uniref:Chaperonin 10-like protein n=1 Tax=Roridomyces roridus TaxID=1738132 RepID=A0AAD7FFM8_9AGAR|nr:chaperonin 10-like protein [Roridomyces roridus]